MHFYSETMSILKKHNKTLDDIVWIGTESVEIPIENFIALADFNYDDGFGAQEVALDLLIVGHDFWLARIEYDGAERWEYHTMPQRPTTMQSVELLYVSDKFVGWKTLAELNDF